MNLSAHKHRNYSAPTQNYSDYGNINITAFEILSRGFTGHEHLTEWDVINMNGRIYDPTIGQFMQPDNFIQSPDDPYSYNRFTYCMNNPLKYTDPSGETPCPSGKCPDTEVYGNRMHLINPSQIVPKGLDVKLTGVYLEPLKTLNPMAIEYGKGVRVDPPIEWNREFSRREIQAPSLSLGPVGASNNNSSSNDNGAMSGQNQMADATAQFKANQNISFRVQEYYTEQLDFNRQSHWKTHNVNSPFFRLLTRLDNEGMDNRYKYCSSMNFALTAKLTEESKYDRIEFIQTFRNSANGVDILDRVQINYHYYSDLFYNNPRSNNFTNHFVSDYALGDAPLNLVFANGKWMNRTNVFWSAVTSIVGRVKNTSDYEILASINWGFSTDPDGYMRQIPLKISYIPYKEHIERLLLFLQVNQ